MSLSRRTFIQKLSASASPFFVAGNVDWERLLNDDHANRAFSKTDFAESIHRDRWLQHPVLGGPSFDAFERLPGNPVWRGKAPLEWPVNGFLFKDPVSNHLFIYVGAYTAGYISKPSRCIGFRSKDQGKTWKEIGTIISPDDKMFDKGGHTPDVSVAFSDGRYHMIYDWGELDFNKEGGIGYAWADKPEGPWNRLPEPVTRNTTLPLMEGRYRRTYAATLIRRKNDWMILGMMDDAPRSWALFAMTASEPQGPYSERKLVRHVRDNYFHPALMEFYPSFVHEGYVYAPATSVALNRNYGAIFRAPLESAHETHAWELYQNGSVWHSGDVESEYEGIWGQTFSGQVDKEGMLWAMFPSRDAKNLGTIHMAKRAWGHPFKEKGFVLNGHAGASLAILKNTYANFEWTADVRLRGTVQFLWNYKGLLGPGVALSDAAVSASASRNYHALELSNDYWKIIVSNEQGEVAVIAEGKLKAGENKNVLISRNKKRGIEVRIDGSGIWKGRLNESVPQSAIGIWLQSRTYLEVNSCKINGVSGLCSLRFDATDALLGAGEDTGDWKGITEGVISKPAYSSSQENARAKWNVPGQSFILWSPRGPELGKMQVLIDGVGKGIIDLYSKSTEDSKPVWQSERLSKGDHAIVLKRMDGLIVVDCLEAQQ